MQSKDFPLDFSKNYFYHNNAMARPTKDKKLLMNVPLRIMVTADQKNQIDQAAKMEQMETATWARRIIMNAALEMIGKKGQRQK